jgi:alpha-galactosidase/6-phospho-beta-glucosidase family protein
MRNAALAVSRYCVVMKIPLRHGLFQPPGILCGITGLRYCVRKIYAFCVYFASYSTLCRKAIQ